MSTYSGWANYHTWNVALWIGGDEGLYNSARHFASAYMNTGTATYADFVADCLSEAVGPVRYVTPDGVSWTDPFLDHEELDDFIRELAE